MGKDSSPKRVKGKSRHSRGKGSVKNVDALPIDEQNQLRDGVFHPSDRQQRFLKSFLEYDGKRFSIDQVCKTAGIVRQTYYVWRTDPQFLKWFNQKRQELSDSTIMIIDRVLHNKATRGDLASIRTVYEKRGELFKRIELDMANEVKVEKSPATLARLLKVLSKMKFPPGVTGV